MKLTNQRGTAQTFKAMNVVNTTAPPATSTGSSGRTHATVTRVKAGGWSMTDYLILATLVVAMLALESRSK